MGRAGTPQATWYLGGLSFAESSFFPIPPDVMLIPMTLARPTRAWFLATITTVTSVTGGLFGYLIGVIAIESIAPLLERAGYVEAYELARNWFERWGLLAVLAAGFSPIPYKVFTIAAGALGMFLPGFVLMSLLGRGARFFLVAGLMKAGGPAMEAAVRRHVEWLGWALVLAIAVLIVALTFGH
ncbi:MAG: YqaA family protein [Pseudomonadota bacterium]